MEQEKVLTFSIFNPLKSLEFSHTLDYLGETNLLQRKTQEAKWIVKEKPEHSPWVVFSFTSGPSRPGSRQQTSGWQGGKEPYALAQWPGGL